MSDWQSPFARGHLLSGRAKSWVKEMEEASDAKPINFVPLILPYLTGLGIGFRPEYFVGSAQRPEYRAMN